MTASFTVFDLEFTAWDGSLATGWLRPGEFKEVVQIGAVKLDAADFTILETFDCLVLPRVNPVLSSYFEALTGITNGQLRDAGEDFAGAYRRFATFAGTGTIAAFGHDEWVLEENARLYGLRDIPALPVFLELRAWFAARGIDPSGMHSCDIGPALGAPFQGRRHNALDDARSIAQGMAVLKARFRDRPAA